MPQSKFEHVKISGMQVVVPPKEICIYDELHYYGGSVKKVDRMRKMVGFWKRRVADRGVTPSDLAIDAGEKLIAGMDIDKKSIDALIFVVQKPDVPNPATAFFIHQKLCLPKNCMAFDINLGCPGWVYGLYVAHSMIESKACKRILLLTGDTPASYLNLDDRIKAPLFGDAASATLLDYSQEPSISPSFFEIGSDGEGFELIIKPGLGERIKYVPQMDQVDPEFNKVIFEPFKEFDGRNVNLAGESYMDGVAVFNFTMTVVPEHIKSLMKFAGESPDTIPYLMLHQANKQIVQTVASAAGFPENKASYEAFENYGNQTISSIPALICHTLKDKLKNNSEKMLCSSFGNGLSWASCIITLGNMFCGGVKDFEKRPDHMGRNEVINYWKEKMKGNIND